MKLILNIRRGIRNLRFWIPKVWDLHDWDYSYLYKLMQFQLERMRHRIGTAQITTSWERDAENMGKAIDILKRLEDGYHWSPDRPYSSTEDRIKKEEEDFNALWDLMKQESRNWWD